MTTARFRTGAASHVGMIRTMNEDSFVVNESVFAVADGMGGHLAGEVASAMAIERMSALSGALSVDDVVNAVINANADILRMSRSDASHRGMGTTLTAVALVQAGDDGSDDRQLAVVNLGDSRTYRLRSGQLEQLTIDHSYVQELVNGGHLTQDEARTHPQRNIVTRALGIENAVGVDVWNMPLVRGDRYLLCSDGLVDEVTDEGIAHVLARFPDPQDAADELVATANRSGGRDNTTVVVIDVLEGEEPPAEMVIDPAAQGDPTDPTPTVRPTVVEDDTPVELEHATIIEEHTQTLMMETSAGAVDLTIVDEPEIHVPGSTKAPKRIPNLRLIGSLGGAALLVGIGIVAVRGNSDDTPPTDVPVTTVAPTTSAAPATPTTLPATTAATTATTGK